MGKETETEETSLICHIFIIVGISIGGHQGPPGPPLATPRCKIITETYQTRISSYSVADWILNLNFIGNDQGL